MCLPLRTSSNQRENSRVSGKRSSRRTLSGACSVSAIRSIDSEAKSWMLIRNVFSTLVSQFDLRTKVWAVKRLHRPAVSSTDDQPQRHHLNFPSRQHSHPAQAISLRAVRMLRRLAIGGREFQTGAVQFCDHPSVEQTECCLRILLQLRQLLLASLTPQTTATRSPAPRTRPHMSLLPRRPAAA